MDNRGMDAVRGLMWCFGIGAVILTPVLLWAHQRECTDRRPFHLDGGAAMQATGTYCAEFRNTWLD